MKKVNMLISVLGLGLFAGLAFAGTPAKTITVVVENKTFQHNFHPTGKGMLVGCALTNSTYFTFTYTCTLDTTPQQVTTLYQYFGFYDKPNNPDGDAFFLTVTHPPLPGEKPVSYYLYPAASQLKITMSRTTWPSDNEEKVITFTVTDSPE